MPTTYTKKEPMEHVWHMVEWLGNITIFFVAGVLTGDPPARARALASRPLRWDAKQNKQAYNS